MVRWLTQSALVGVAHAPNFSRRTTHLLCPSGVGAKADKAREWGTPIVDMAWPTALARTGEIPPAPLAQPQPQSAHEQEPQARELDDGGLDIEAVKPEPRAQDDWMASQPQSQPARVDKGKEREKSAEGTMADITNAEARSWSRSLSYYDPAPGEPCPGQAEQMAAEGFGEPSLLVDAAMESAEPEVSGENELLAMPPAADNSDAVSIPSSVYEDRVPSSESPSPLRIPGAATPRDLPSTPSKPERIARQPTMGIPGRGATLLGKRPSEEDDEGHPAKLKRHDSRLGYRPKPLHRSRVRDERFADDASFP